MQGRSEWRPAALRPRPAPSRALSHGCAQEKPITLIGLAVCGHRRGRAALPYPDVAPAHDRVYVNSPRSLGVTPRVSYSVSPPPGVVSELSSTGHHAGGHLDQEGTDRHCSSISRTGSRDASSLRTTSIQAGRRSL